MSYTPHVADVWKHLDTQAFSGALTADFNLVDGYKVYVLHLANIVPSVNATQLYLRMSIGLGAPFLSGVSDYAWSVKGRDFVTSSIVTSSAAADSKLNLTRNSTQLMGNVAGHALHGFIYIHNAKQAVNAVTVTAQLVQQASDGTLFSPQVRGGLIANISAINSIRLLASSGNLSGSVALYGVN